MISNFSFVLDGRLAGFAFPGRGDSLRDSLASLTAERSIGAMVSLTETPPDPSILREWGVRHHHMPVPDFGAPTLEQMEKAAQFALDCLERGVAVVAHCGAGQGRTGLFLACCLVALGYAPQEAIQTVRTRRPGSIETPEQEQFVHLWADWRSKNQSRFKPKAQ